MTRIPHMLALATLVLAGCAHAPTAQHATDPGPAPAVAATAPDATAPTPAPAVSDAQATSASAPEDTTDAAIETTDDATSAAAIAASSPDTAAVAVDDPRTEAEREYDALYGGDQEYDPIADPTLPDPAELALSYDPWEGFNRRMHSFNNVVDRVIAKPLAKVYMVVLPRPVRLGIGNFFSNLGQPLTAFNSVLQGKPKQAAQALGRFALNATLGIGGVFDPATDLGLPNKNEDFGQTLGVWGWKQSRYLELPLFGPRTVRDLFGMSGDAPFALLRPIESDKVRVFLQGLQLVDLRTQLMAVDSMREGATDDYALLRDAWTQRRNYQIFGDRQLEGDDSLPDYLREEDNPTVPIDAIPMTPMDRP